MEFTTSQQSSSTSPSLGLSIPTTSTPRLTRSLSTRTADGHSVSLLNTPEELTSCISIPSNTEPRLPSISTLLDSVNQPLYYPLPPFTHIIPKTLPSKRKYHCQYPGCGKSFTTSGHLSRHNRIHTGEKNYHCFYPGCTSRFSRQDNMMQHYRTHLSPASSRMRRRNSHQHYNNYSEYLNCWPY